MHLKRLDLIMNNFDAKPMPEFLGILVKLEYLNLSYTGFAGGVPPHLGNLSSIRFLDLHCKSDFYDCSPLSIGKCVHWLSRITSLEYLDMSIVNLSKLGDNWIHDINKLSSISLLLLSNVGFSNIPHTLSHINLTSLAMLDLSDNTFASTVPVGYLILPLFGILTLDIVLSMK